MPKRNFKCSYCGADLFVASLTVYLFKGRFVVQCPVCRRPFRLKGECLEGVAFGCEDELSQPTTD